MMNSVENRPGRSNGPGTYSSEYVELKMELRDLAGLFKAELAKVLAKLESLERSVREMQREAVRLDNQVQSNRASIASLRAAATALGAVAGTAVSFVLRLITGGAGSG